jgi:threonine synthase
VVAVPTLPDRWTLVREGVERHGWFPVQNFLSPPVGANPYALDGAKTVGFELCEQLAWRAPDVVVAPVSYGDLPVATWRGFLEFRALGLIDRVPRMMAAEVFGPVANALARGLDHTEPMPGGRSVATSAAATNSTYQSLRMVRDTGGLAVTATDDEIMAAQLDLAESEGLWAEPAAALPLAALRKLAARGAVGPDELVVAVVTSTGLKDPEATAARLPAIPLIEPTFAALQRVLDGA